ncbi:MAG TPA: hypothetical protein VFD84_04200 [Candidatus Binatia bacterium]|nr:hypothetical protein [Candidatus Binatia bacterium]
MTDDGATIRPGDRVVHLQVPGVFVVVGRTGRLLELQSERGLQMRVHEIQVRRLDGPPPPPADA